MEEPMEISAKWKLSLLIGKFSISKIVSSLNITFLSYFLTCKLTR